MNIQKTFAMILAITLYVSGCKGQESHSQNTLLKKEENSTYNIIQKDTTEQEPLITFVELGSVNCVPCRKMQPVMKAIEEKYASQVRVIFYDIWQADQKKYAQEYNIRLIPTQVFLDKEGEEIFRHEGFFPEMEIDAFLKKQGLKPKSES